LYIIIVVIILAILVEVLIWNLYL